MKEFYIITAHHRAIWPQGVLLFWAPNRSGYSSTLDRAGRYSEEEAKEICACRGGVQEDFMVPCEEIEAQAVRVVDLDTMKKFTGKSSWEFE